ncbi:NifB/NifX family molybdenum-iron cluster-binding protein [Pectinatus brassicae]|uniref:Putative Fe-Mo cluster-binding NifX family protein n=1 Tax=Pectinatus brassicae TaxID=862415 RepID=A0A840URW2_9FIRM|nr:NifB/NifX family molybdenum-iron cluster-binding protein [Pectinatus brassicae]MBB5337488.1 putative Fe-Mo cluster-binding NifX family protein [Pectinatus brassicae]
MKIAIPAEDKNIESNVSQTFGRTNYFIIYDMEAKQMETLDNSAIASQGGAGIKAAQLVLDNGVQVLIAPQCGQNAADVLAEGDIKIYASIEGTVKANIDAYTAGKLVIMNDIHAGYHGGK